MVSPYKKPLIHTKQVMGRFFKYDAENKTMIFVGNTLEIRVPKRFEVYNLLTIEETVMTVGVMDFIIDDTYQASMVMLAKVQVETSDISEITVDGVPYLVMRLTKGQKLTTHTTTVKDKNIIYALYVEFITRGKMLYTMQYDDQPMLFDRAKEVAGTGIGVDRVVFEIIHAHLNRDPDNLAVQYRHTAMTKPPRIIALRSVSFAPSSTQARLLGSYFNEAADASLIYANSQSQPFENLLRGLPAPAEDAPF